MAVEPDVLAGVAAPAHAPVAEAAAVGSASAAVAAVAAAASLPAMENLTDLPPRMVDAVQAGLEKRGCHAPLQAERLSLAALKVVGGSQRAYVQKPAAWTLEVHAPSSAD